MDFCRGDDLGKLLCEAIGLDHSRVRRVILDVEAGAVVRIFVETHGSRQLLDLDWSRGLQGAEITALDK